MTRPAPVAAITRVRGLALDEARRELAACLRAETEAEARLRAATEAIARETEAASDLDAGDLDVEAFAAWLPRGRRVQAEAEAALSLANARTARARAGLSAARAGSEAAQALHDRLLAEEQAERDRMAQHELDDVARRGPTC